MNADAHVRRLWRKRGTTVPAPRRGPRPGLDLDDILAAGIALADADGLAAVTTRAVAAVLGKTAMALYPYVGTKDNLLALMRDQASTMPAWEDPGTTLADALTAWADALYGVYLAHPWLTERSWSQASQGPNEQDWLERLLAILDEWHIALSARPPAVTMLFATVRATAETDAAYRRMSDGRADEWLQIAQATQAHIPDFAARYPLTTGLPPRTPDWRDAPRAGLAAAVRLLAEALPVSGP
ncbi:TetR/AcrR family transcriptional regulator C-terminal domain-containing protein [Actinoplanes sp. NPDC051859]|uniref:TetR/AcrR family transcriptional regulator C-terminal domain-containing protein n=1 Tax=Actinoplanes sp. NPDC051859 TaxID=3363909 RepID=UPI0037BC32C4